MIAPNCLYLLATVFVILGWGGSVLAEDDVTVVPAPAASTAPAQKTAAGDGTPVIHKSLHKKKHPATAVASTSSVPATNSAAATPPAKSAPPDAPTVVVGPAATPSVVVVSGANQPHVVAPSKPTVTISPAPSPAPVVAKALAQNTSSVPTVETGLPVARYPGMGAPIKGVSTYIPTPIPASSPAPVKTVTGTTTHLPYYSSVIQASVLPPTSSSTDKYSSLNRTSNPSTNFVFTDYGHKSGATYPWKTGIITTEFWIGEGGSTISSTDNIGSAWDEHWRSTNRGSDNPDDRNGFASADHASTVNPFYVALPFNDLAFPDKARDWVPRSWHRPPEDGKQVSACKDRWVWIKNANGRSCFAQWEDVGPLRTDHAEYVFGSERPDTYTRAGLDVSPAVAQYLGIDENKRAITSWRFIDDVDVPPGQWLKYDEQAVIYTALHQLKSSSPSTDLPIQRLSEPVDEPGNPDNKKKVDASKG